MPKITQLLDGIPAVSDQGQVGFCAVALIEGEDRDGVLRRIVVDTAHCGRRVLLVDSLAKLGLSTLDIDYVLSTHAHWDHMQNIDLFSNATMLMHGEERKYAHDPAVDDWATPSWTGYVLEQLKIPVVGEGPSFSRGVGVRALTGPSGGWIGATVETEEGLAVLTSDAFHLASVAKTKINPLVFWDEKAATASIERVIETADLIYPGHDAPFRVLAGGEVEYLKTLSFGIAGMKPAELSVEQALPPTMMPGRQDPARIDEWRRRGAERIGERGPVTVAYDAGLAPVPSHDWEFVK